jgi:hypothetical protein
MRALSKIIPQRSLIPTLLFTSQWKVTRLNFAVLLNNIWRVWLATVL